MRIVASSEMRVKASIIGYQDKDSNLESLSENVILKCFSEDVPIDYVYFFYYI